MPPRYAIRVPGTAFLSYSHTDRKYVLEITRHLTDAGISLWADQAVGVGDQFDEQIQRQIDNCAVFMVVLTPEAVASRWVLREIKYADESSVPIVPLLLKPCKIPIRLSGTQYEDVTGGRLPSIETVTRLRRLTGAEGAPLIDLSGHWVGQQTGNTIPSRYQLHLTQQGSQIIGTARADLILSEAKESYVVFELTGSVEGSTLKFKQLSILDSEPADPDSWCLIRASLTYSNRYGLESLTGNYKEARRGNQNPACRNVSGKIDLRRK
jgi:TIR domain